MPKRVRVERTRGGGKYTERWLPVVGYEGLYEVSDLGRVKSMSRKVKHPYGTRSIKERLLNPTIANNGYPSVSLCRNNKSEFRTVHGLVLTAFDRKRHPKEDARHLDGNRINCTLANLKWGTREENAEDTLVHGRRVRGETSPLSKLTTDQVLVIRDLLNAKVKQRVIAAKYGLTQQGISDIKNRRAWAWLEKHE